MLKARLHAKKLLFSEASILKYHDLVGNQHSRHYWRDNVRYAEKSGSKFDEKDGLHKTCGSGNMLEILFNYQFRLFRS